MTFKLTRRQTLAAFSAMAPMASWSPDAQAATPRDALVIAKSIDDTITLPVFEEEMDEDLGDVVVLYDEWNGSIKIPLDRNKEIEFETASRTFRVKGFSDASSGEFIDTFYIKFLKLA